MKTINCKRLSALSLAMLMALSGCGGEKASSDAQNTAAPAAFEPALDTEKAVDLEAAVFFGNFEALDQVINRFSDYYPNVTITYNQVGSDGPEVLLPGNTDLDIFMTSLEAGYPEEYCLDLTGAGIDVSGLDERMLASTTADGKLLSLPMGQKLRGMAVNKTLLENEGLSVPQTWSEFLDTLDALKNKGYTPIQGPQHFIGMMNYNMGMNLLNTDKDLYDAVMRGDAAAADSFKAVFDRLAELRDKGYFSAEVNAEYPEDNYDAAILKFFEGDVPFWVCDTEKFSGMKKRESKSEAFTASPFEYEFDYIPFGENGVYEYIEPWYGFAVNKNSTDADYAAEFLRFMAQPDEMNALASVKGVPSIASTPTDERYTHLRNLDKVESTVICDNSVPVYLGTLLNSASDKLLSGEAADADAALQSFVAACAQ